MRHRCRQKAIIRRVEARQHTRLIARTFAARELFDQRAYRQVSLADAHVIAIRKPAPTDIGVVATEAADDNNGLGPFGLDEPDQLARQRLVALLYR